jgi:hypothetical protein
MAARTPPPAVQPGLQLTWSEGHAYAWQPGRGPAGGNLHDALRRVTGARHSGWGTRMLRLQLPEGSAPVICQQLDAGTLAALGDLDLLRREVSPSVAWFGALHRYATTLVERGRVTPMLTHMGTVDNRSSWWSAQWQPLPDDVAAAAELLAAMPPVVAAAEVVQAEALLHTMVDSACRHTLAARGWPTPLADTRSFNGRALRLVGRALTAAHGQFAVSVELGEAVAHIATELATASRRAAGEPIVRARVRLALPGEGPGEGFSDSAATDVPAGEGWPLTLELVDVDDRSRWCTAEQLHAGHPTALALADDKWQHLLHHRLHAAGEAIAAAVPELAAWLADPSQPVAVEVAAAALEGSEALAVAGVELLAPERLTRRSPTTRGTAQPNDRTGGGRFTASALVEWQVVVDDAPVPEEVLRRAAADGANLIEIGGRWVQIDRAEARRALANLQMHRREHAEMGALELLALAAELNRELEAAGLGVGLGGELGGEPGVGLGVDALRATGWAGQLLAGLPDDALAEGAEPPGFTATLRHYQRRGLGWLQFLRRLGLGGCLADDMGLGKTPTTLAHLVSIPGPHLVVCPLSVVRNWQTEAARFTPMMRVLVHHGATRTHAAEFAHAVAAHDLVITTYQVATRDLDSLHAVEWSTVVLDEAQAVKNPDTHTSRAMRSIKAEQHIALTGTPVENRLSELWSIFQVVAPGLLGNMAQFRRQFVVPIEKDHDLAATHELRRLTGPFLLRRTKADRSLVPDLPDKVEQVAWATLTREQAHMYQGVVDQLLLDAQAESGMRRRGLVLAALTRLKQICNHPAHALGDGSKLAGRSGKLHRFDELVTDLLDADEQALVFTQFREMGLLLQQHLHERFDQRAPFLHGGVPKAQRDRMVQAFQDGAAPSPLLLVSLKAGGTGLNLTAASRVVHYDRWWNPAVEDQATDRAWRIGQSRAVFVHKLVCSGTVEERIDALITDKRALADAVVGTTGETWLSELSTDDLRSLVMLDSRTVGAL